MTKLETLNELLALDGLTEAQVTFVEKEIALLEKRKSAGRGETATQKANAELKGVILDILADVDEGSTATDIAKALDVSVQKASAILRQMVLTGEVTKTEAKGKIKATFAV